MNNVDAKNQKKLDRIREVGFDIDQQSRIDISECNLCGNQRFVVITRRDRYGFNNKACTCLKCGLVFLNPVMTEKAYREFYKTTYRKLVSAYHGKSISADTLKDEQEKYGYELSDFIAAFMEKRVIKTLLDIGGSIGIVAKILTNHYKLKTTILDPAPSEIKEARKLKFETVTGMLRDLDNISGKFDLIIMCQTIDHLIDINGDLKRVRVMINEGGLVYIDIIDFRAIYLREQSIKEAIKPDHPYYLTEFSVESYLRLTGFKILRKEYVDHRVGYLCEPAKPEVVYLPDKSKVDEMLREIRYVQNYYMNKESI